MNRLEKAISVVCQVLLWISTLVIFVILTANTVLRYVTGSSLQWANEVPELLFPWLVMAGVVMAALHGAHITTGFLMEKLPDQIRKGVGLLAWLVVSALYGTLTVATWRMLEIVHDEKSPILQIPGSVTYACVMGGMAMLAVLALNSAWQLWTRPAAAMVSDAPAQAHW
jgi:TRAP-type C4-dicarboxylate transport system permease small subunit